MTMVVAEATTPGAAFAKKVTLNGRAKRSRRRPLGEIIMNNLSNNKKKPLNLYTERENFLSTLKTSAFGDDKRHHHHHHHHLHLDQPESPRIRPGHYLKNQLEECIDKEAGGFVHKELCKVFMCELHRLKIGHGKMASMMNLDYATFSSYFFNNLNVNDHQQNDRERRANDPNDKNKAYWMAFSWLKLSPLEKMLPFYPILESEEDKLALSASDVKSIPQAEKVISAFKTEISSFVCSPEEILDKFSKCRLLDSASVSMEEICELLDLSPLPWKLFPLRKKKLLCDFWFWLKLTKDNRWFALNLTDHNQAMDKTAPKQRKIVKVELKRHVDRNSPDVQRICDIVKTELEKHHIRYEQLAQMLGSSLLDLDALLNHCGQWEDLRGSEKGHLLSMIKWLNHGSNSKDKKMVLLKLIHNKVANNKSAKMKAMKKKEMTATVTTEKKQPKLNKVKPLVKPEKVQLTDSQKTSLMAEYKDNPFPSTARKNELGSQLGCSFKEVNNFFNNERRKAANWRKKKAKIVA